MPQVKNWNCDGGHCQPPYDSQVKIYPLGAGGNLILCLSCWAHENRYRYLRCVELKDSAAWPQVDWHTAEIYPRKETGE